MAFSFELKTDTAKFSVNSDGKFIKTYNRMYLCKNETELTIDQVCANVGILPGAPFVNWSPATCHLIDPVRLPTVEPHCAWEVSYEWSTDAVVPQDSADTAPENRRVKRRTGTSTQQRFILRDRLNKMILDAAGSPYDGGVPVTVYLGTLVFERDETHNSSKMSQAALLSGKLNSTTFMGCAPETLLLEVTGEEKYEGAYHFWTFVYTMTYDKDGWQPQPANAGLYQLVSGQRTRIEENDGTATVQPQPLTVSGTVIPEASRPAACNFIDVDFYPTFNFATLGLPTT